MWTIGTLKSQGKIAMMPYYWMGVLVCFIAGLLGGGTGIGSFTSGISSSSNFSSSNREYLYDSASYINPTFLIAFLGVFAIILIGTIVFSIFVGNVITVGRASFFLESRKQGMSGGVGRLFIGFGGGNYLNIIKIMFLKGLFELLWTLLLIIPGIYKSYEYYMIPYLLADNPGIDAREAFRLSKVMMNGNRFHTWGLELSFFGWYLLGGLACGVGTLFVHPYFEATLVELYLHMKETSGLNTFGVEAQVVEDAYYSPS